MSDVAPMPEASRRGTVETPLSPGVYENWHQWQKVRHGSDCLQYLGAELDRLQITRPLLITTRSLTVQGTLLASVRDAVPAEIVAQFSETEPHTPRETVLAAARAARQARPDGIISFGGSTVIDTAKGVALALAADIARASDFDRYARSAEDGNGLAAGVLPHIALPTTLSGAEYSCDIGITDPLQRKKEIFHYDGLAPRTILLDPLLASATPARLWGATGIKVMSDAIEQLYGKASHPIIDALCVSAIRWFSRYLPLFEHPDSALRTDARLRCQLASWKTLFGMRNAGTRVGIGGALRHQLGGMFRIPHGEATCVMLPHILRFNFPEIRDGYRTLAEALDLDAAFASKEARLEAIIEHIRDLISKLGLPDRLGPLGARRTDLSALASHVMQEAGTEFNPRTVADPREIVALLDAAF
ncbi:MAG: iron-containing alcohol dehydrogenase [Casimicrobiaceae bacterium]